MNVFLAGNAATTGRDLALLNRIGFTWQKSLFQWRQIEGEGAFDWRDSDRVAASQAAGVKIIARLDFQPRWARADRASNGPPDEYRHYADFVRVFVDRYRAGPQRGTVHAVEIWNEPNIDREAARGSTRNRRPTTSACWSWRTRPPRPPIPRSPSSALLADLHGRREGQARRRLPAVDLRRRAPRPTSTSWAPTGPATTSRPLAGRVGRQHNGCRVFTFRRVEDLRAVMVRNGDGAKQVWLLEFGWTTDRQNPAYAWHAVSPETHGDYVVDAYRWAYERWAPWIGVMVLWNLPDPNWGRDREEYWWGIANPGWHRAPP